MYMVLYNVVHVYTVVYMYTCTVFFNKNSLYSTVITSFIITLQLHVHVHVVQQYKR